MPTYVYKREDGTTFEVVQRITEPSLKICPTTGQPVQRVISGGTGLVFKGSGFYLTDYARKGAAGSPGASKDGGSESKSDTKSDSDSSATKSGSDNTSSSSDSKPASGSKSGSESRSMTSSKSGSDSAASTSSSKS